MEPSPNDNLGLGLRLPYLPLTTAWLAVTGNAVHPQSGEGHCLPPDHKGFIMPGQDASTSLPLRLTEAIHLCGVLPST